MTEMGCNDRRPRLLILDDDLMIGETIQRMAQSAGFEVRFTESAEIFLRDVCDWQPDIIALDLIMPGMDGVEVMAALARLECSARLVISSGVGSRVLDAAYRSAQAHGLNIVGVLAKPFSASELRGVLKRALVTNADDERRRQIGDEGLRAPTAVDLLAALEQRQITLLYQPKVDCRTATVVGFEALARWYHPELGEIPPDVFIELAEHHGLVDRLTLQVVDQALAWLAAVTADAASLACGARVLHQALLAINISARSLTNAELFESVSRRCNHYGISPQRIVLELTETSAMEDVTVSLDTLTRLRLQGFLLSIDDFGTGFSSMVQLVRLPFSEIKVDKSFVMTAGESAESRAVVRSIVDLGRSLGLKATAEGVENEVTLAFLRKLGCDFAQGYMIARPLEPQAVLPWHKAREEDRERRRQSALDALGILDTPAEYRFDRFTLLAVRLFGVSTALICLIDRDRQWFKSHQGVAFVETPREVAFCNTAIETDSQMVINDASQDPYFCDNPLVLGELGIRFYAGRPLCLPGGEKLGTLCLIENTPRPFSAQEAALLDDLGEMVEQELLPSAQEEDDPCTGLLARNYFLTQAHAALQLCERRGLHAVFVTTQIDDLVRVNKYFGRDVGDHLLRSLGQIMADVGVDAFLAGRYRGTEMAALLVGADLGAAQQMCRHLEDAIVTWNRLQGSGDALLNVRIGVSEPGALGRGSVDRVLEDARQTYLVVDPG